MLFKTGIPKSTLKCVLLIDDDKLTNFVNKIIVDTMCCPDHVVRKESVRSALEYLSDSADSYGQIPFPDLIFLDIDMPNSDGWQFLNSFKDIKNNLPYVPVIIMLSGFVDSQTISKASSFGDLAGIIKKPMSTENYNEITSEYFTPGVNK